MDQEHQPKLKVVRKRRKSVKSRIRARANEQAKLAALEARKVAALEYVGELLEEAIGLLKAEGFKASRMRDAAVYPNPDVPSRAILQPMAVQNPCTWCGHEGVMLNEDKSGWVCQAHAQYEVGGAVQDKQAQNLYEQMSKRPVVQAPRLPPKPAGPKLLIHPTASESLGRQERPEPHTIDPLKGAIDAAANAGVDSDEAGTQ